jgi:hypothetical protein
MKLTNVPPIINQANRPNDDLSLVIQQQDWLKTISLGQIIKGKVLKVYDGNRYGVMMGGQERVVDSTIAFHVGQQLSTKVMDIQGDKVSLKLTERSSGNETFPAKPEQTTAQTLVDSLIREFNLQRLTTAQQQSIDGIAKSFKQDRFAIKLALYLAKNGLPVSEPLIRNLMKSAAEPVRLAVLETPVDYADLSRHSAEMPLLYQAIAEAFGGASMHPENENETAPESRTQDGVRDQNVTGGYTLASMFQQRESGFDDESEQTPFMKLLNIDTEGAIAHSFDVLSLIINDRLLEFDVAFFDQAHTQTGATSSKQIVFELETGAGKVGVVAKLVNNRLSLAFNAEQSALLEALQQQKETFSETLTEAGWVLEQAHYASHTTQGSAMAAVIDHVLAQGSMEREL